MINILEYTFNLIQEVSGLPYRQRVEVIIKNQHNHIMLILFPPHGYASKKPILEFVGGGVEPGDTLIKTCKKEALEEVGVAITNIKRIRIPTFESNWENSEHVSTKKKAMFKGTETTFFIADYKEKDMRLYGSAGDEVDYIFVSVVKAIPMIKQQINRFKKEDPQRVPLFEYYLKVLRKL